MVELDKPNGNTLIIEGFHDPSLDPRTSIYAYETVIEYPWNYTVRIGDAFGIYGNGGGGKSGGSNDSGGSFFSNLWNSIFGSDDEESNSDETSGNNSQSGDPYFDEEGNPNGMMLYTYDEDGNKEAAAFEFYGEGITATEEENNTSGLANYAKSFISMMADAMRYSGIDEATVTYFNRNATKTIKTINIAQTGRNLGNTSLATGLTLTTINGIIGY